MASLKVGRRILERERFFLLEVLAGGRRSRMPSCEALEPGVIPQTTVVFPRLELDISTALCHPFAGAALSAT